MAVEGAEECKKRGNLSIWRQFLIKSFIVDYAFFSSWYIHIHAYLRTHWMRLGSKWIKPFITIKWLAELDIHNVIIIGISINLCANPGKESEYNFYNSLTLYFTLFPSLCPGVCKCVYHFVPISKLPVYFSVNWMLSGLD